MKVKHILQQVNLVPVTNKQKTENYLHEVQFKISFNCQNNLPEIHFINENTVEKGQGNIWLIWLIYRIMTSSLGMLYNFIFRMIIYEIRPLGCWRSSLSQFGKIPTSKFWSIFKELAPGKWSALCLAYKRCSTHACYFFFKNLSVTFFSWFILSLLLSLYMYVYMHIMYIQYRQTLF